ncbi:MAG: hypothetical protein U0795_21635 [Pirellulales bacterium]
MPEPDEQDDVPGESEVRRVLGRILRSAEFLKSGQLSDFLKFVVEQALDGQGDRIKERQVAIRALGRSREFDPRRDSIVRVVAGRLRRALSRYQAARGAHDGLHIELPKGTYCPVFRRHTHGGPWSDRSDARGSIACGYELMSDGLRRRPILAIAPLEPAEGCELERHLAGRVTDELSRRLSRCHWFGLIDLASVGKLPAGRWNIDEYQRQAADFLLTGALRSMASGRLVELRLTELQGGRLIWTDRMLLAGPDVGEMAPERAVEPIAAMLGDLFGVLAGAVWTQSQGQPLNRLTACQAALKSLRYQMHLADDLYDDAVRSAEWAVKIDPDFSWGWANLAVLYLDAHASIADCKANDHAERAWWCVRQARRSDPEGALGTWALGLYNLMAGRTVEAVEAVHLAAERAVGLPFELGASGAVLASAGDLARGRELIQQAIAMNPRLPGWIHWGATIHDLSTGNHELALATLPRFSLPDCFWDHLFRGTVLAETGQMDEAIRALSTARRLRPQLAERARDIVPKIVGNPHLQRRLIDSLALGQSTHPPMG